MNFISSGFPGCLSDNEITKACGFGDYLSKGDKVMCDKGFTILDFLKEKGADYISPAFLKRGQDQLTAAGVKKVRDIANLRIHVERFIGLIKNYHFFNKTLHINQLTVVTSLVQHICAVINLIEVPRIGKVTRGT